MMLDSCDEYNRTIQGETPPPNVMAILTHPTALRARAAVRIALAAVDEREGNTLAAWRNRCVAAHMLRAADRHIPTGPVP